MVSANIFKKHERRTRILACLEHFGREALINILHNRAYSILPRDPKDLYNALQQYKPVLTNLMQRGVLKQDQFDLIYPPNLHDTDSSQFDIPIFCILIRHCTNLPAPMKGWYQKVPDQNDHSIASFVIRIRELRNSLYHPQKIKLTYEEFSILWNDLSYILKGLKFKQAITYLKAAPLDCLPIDYIKVQQEIMINLMEEKRKSYVY